MVTQKVSEPVQDAVKAYLELAFGLTEASKKKAEKTVKKVTKELVGKSGATAAQLQTLAEDLLATGNANREAVSRMVRVEMDRALSRVGLATAEEVAALNDRIEALERQLRDAKAAPAASDEPPVAAKKTVAKKAVAKKATEAEPVIKAAGPAAKRPMPRVAADKEAPEAIAAVHAAAAKAPAKKAVAKKATKAAKATP
ncbi:phasin family protein [Rhizocola hellebori]|nr:phasin family protein [Rhizocola hellebori]